MNPPSEGRGAAAGTGAAAASSSGFISRYQILDKIGEGGMGALFLARDPAIDRLVAIKLLRRGLDTPELRDRFAREARAAGRLRHPNIVTIFDVGDHDGDPFIAMEFLAGETLHELVQAQARLSLARRLKLLEELCDGLAYAHRAGVIHRDIKPANLLVDSEGVLKILDFGIVRLDDGAATQSGVLVGTLNYMSPEQVSGGPVDRRSDIFSVGLVAYELLSGRQAFPGTIRDGLLNKILTAAVEPLANLMPGLDRDVSAIVDRALEPAAEHRYPDLTRMRNDLIQVRKRIEALEEALGTDGEAEGGETMFVTRPGVPTPASGNPPEDRPPDSGRLGGVAEAERALKAGEYRVALTLAGRSAAANPADPSAALIMARAQTALLDRGRALDSGTVPPPVPPTGLAASPAAPAELPTSVRPADAGSRRALWYGGGAAILVLVLAMIAWIARSPEPSAGGAVQAEPSVPAPLPAGAPAATDSPPPAQETGKAAEPPPPTPAMKDAAPAPRPPREAAAPRMFVVGRDGVQQPRRIRYVEPVYPTAAAESRTEGAVGVELTVGRDGKVADARVTRSVAGLDQAALAAVRQWEFLPVMVRGAAVPVVYPVTVPFMAPAAPKPADTPSAAEPSTSSPPPSPPPAAPAAAVKEVPRLAEPPPVDLRAEENAVRGVLQQYRAAWEARDADAVARVHRLSSEALNNVRATLRSAEEYRMGLDIQSVILEPGGQRARVRASIVRTYNPRAGNPITIAPTMSTFTLEKRDGRWVITGIT